MNNKLEKFAGFIKDKKVAVLGIGISNRPLIRFLARFGCKMTAFDQLTASDPVISQTKEDFARQGISLEWSLGPDYLHNLQGFDVIFRTPKLRWDLAELLAERERGAVITSEMEVFLELCPAPVFGITGSDGKTTTSTLISLILAQAGYKVHLGGNIGMPLLDQVEKISPADKVVLELSSFQLMSMRISPETAVVTNISPNHLDVHKDYQEYIDAKRNILLYQPFYSRLILNQANYESFSLTAEARGEVVFFNGQTTETSQGFVLENGWLVMKDKARTTRIVKAAEILIPGQHNVENYLAAAAATWPYVKADDIAAVARSFPGVEHRLELVRELDNVRYYNSSIDTSPTRTKAALRALADRQEKAVLILGGQDKKSDYSGLGEAILSVSRKIVYCGANADLIDKALRREAGYCGVLYEDLEITRCQDYACAVEQARKLAQPGEVVVLSPAGTSYDMFRHFEERGDLFKELVRQLE